MNILIITPYTLENNNAASSCIGEIINGLQSKIDRIYYFSINQIDNTEVSYEKDGINYHLFASPQTLKYSRIMKSVDNRFLKRVVRKIRFIFYRMHNFYKFELHQWDTKFSRMAEAFLEIMSINKIDAIISFSLPFKSHTIAMKLKNISSNVKWIAYELDPYAYNFSKNKYFRNIRKIIELRTLKEADFIYSTTGIIEYNCKMHFRENLLYKSESIPLPNLHVDINDIYEKAYEYDFCYIGSFYKKIRNPKDMFKLLSLLLNEKKIALVGSDVPWDALENLNVLSKKNNIRTYGWLTRKDADKILLSTRILLNIGNTIPNQFPSKIMEYIATGKKILNFYYLDDDPGLKVLKMYKNSFNVKISDYYDNHAIDKIKEFIDEPNHLISKEELLKNFKDYETISIVNKILNKIGE